jgi:hypothetical protein
VAVNHNKVLFVHSTHSLHVSVHTGHLQVNIIISYEASYAFLKDPLLRLFTHLHYYILHIVSHRNNIYINNIKNNIL